MRQTARLIPCLLGLLLAACQSLSPAGATRLPEASTVPPQATFTPLLGATPFPSVTSLPTVLPPTRTPLQSTPIACEEEHGRIETYTLDTDLLRRPWQVRVYLPPCYAPYPAQRYPVLYMLHGQGYNDDQWDRLGIDEAADDLIRSGSIPPFFIIMPYEVDSLAYTGDAPYDRAVIEVLLPWAEATFPVCQERACRAAGGLSRGGGWAMRMAFKYWPVFGAVGGHSLTPFGSDVDLYPIWYARIPAGKIPRLYIDIGEKDRYLLAATNFKDWLVKLGIPVEWHLNPGTHNEEYWSTHVREYISWYAAGFK